jgi:hypothetical protein
MDETRDSGRARGGKNGSGASDIAGIESGTIGGIDDTGYMDNGAGTSAKASKRGRVGKITSHPKGTRPGGLRAPCQGSQRQVRQRLHTTADKAGSTGDRDGHAIPMIAAARPMGDADCVASGRNVKWLDFARQILAARL